MSRAWSKGSTSRWRKIRAAVLADNLTANGGRCAVALAGTCTGLATEVHHVLGRNVSGDDPRYLQATCKACNLAIGEPGRVSPAPRPVTKW